MVVDADKLRERHQKNLRRQKKQIVEKLGYIPDSIMINVPENFFVHNYSLACPIDKKKWMDRREQAFRHHYEAMGVGEINEDSCFYHFISSVPVLDELLYVYVCFRGFIQYRAILVQFLKNQPVMLPTYQHPEPRDWCITTGPVVKAPAGEFPQAGFRGFKYCSSEKLF